VTAATVNPTVTAGDVLYTMVLSNMANAFHFESITPRKDIYELKLAPGEGIAFRTPTALVTMHGLKINVTFGEEA